MDLLFFSDALHNLESDSRSSRLSTRIDELGQEYKQMLKIERNMQQIGKNIDYAISKFQEVDAKCAQALKASSYNYRSKVGLLTNEEKYGGIAGAALDWGKAAWKKYNEINGDIISSEKKAWNKAKLKLGTLGNEAGAFIKKNWVYISNGIDIACDVLTVGIAVATRVACPPLAIAAIAFAASDGIQSVTKMYNYYRTSKTGKGNEGNGFNLLEIVTEKIAGTLGFSKEYADGFYTIADTGIALASPGKDSVEVYKIRKEVKAAKGVMDLKREEVVEKSEAFASRKKFNIIGQEKQIAKLNTQLETVTKNYNSTKMASKCAGINFIKDSLIYSATSTWAPKGLLNYAISNNLGYQEPLGSVMWTETDNELK
jgi:hypothetical protein